VGGGWARPAAAAAAAAAVAAAGVHAPSATHRRGPQRGSAARLVDELAAAYHGEPLFVVAQRRTLALRDGVIGVDSDDQVGAQRQALPEGVGVAVVEEVEGAVHEDPDLLPPNRQGRARLPLQLSTQRHDVRLRLLELGSHQV